MNFKNNGEKDENRDNEEFSGKANNISDLRINYDDIVFENDEEFIKISKKYSKNFDSLVKYDGTKIGKSLEKSKNKIALGIERLDFKDKKDKFKSISLKYYSKVKDKSLEKYDIFKKSKAKSYLDEYFLKYFGKYSKLGIFLIILIFSSFLIKSVVEYKVNSAYNNLIQIKNTRDGKKIEELLKKSSNDFKISSFLFFPFSFIPLEQVQSAKHIIYGGKQISYALNNILSVYNNLDKSIKENGFENLEITKILKEEKQNIFLASKDLDIALSHYNKVKTLGKKELDEKFLKGKVYLNKFKDSLNTVVKDYDNFLNILGDKKEKKYLLLFQNADEIRPTGGFFGSMGIVSFHNGKLRDFESKDVYMHEWNLKSINYEKKKAPEGLNKITPYLGLRDSNHYANIKDSSESINFFMKKLGYKLDGIIYINSSIVEEYLKLTGDIEFDKINETINSYNFSKIISMLVESKKFRETQVGTPKQILFDFIDIFKGKLAEKGKYLSYAKLIFDSIGKREVMIYSFLEEENKLLSKLGFGGKIDFDKTLDYSYPVYTSISGNKSDRYVKRFYEKIVEKNSDCSFTTSLKISLSHNFGLSEEINIKKLIKKYGIKNEDESLFIQGRGQNWQYVKLLIPKDSIVRESKNYKINETETKKYITFYLKTNRYETSSIIINYTLPNLSCEKYNFNFYKQPGIRKYDFLYKNNKKDISIKNVNTDLSF